MNKKLHHNIKLTRALAAATIFLLVVSIIYLNNYSAAEFIKTEPSAKIAGDKSQTVIDLQPSFYNEATFDSAVLNSKDKLVGSGNIYGLIVPHHLLAADFIAQGINLAASRDRKTVVIIGPNHDNLGTHSLATTAASWQTPFGEVRSSFSLVNQLNSDFNLQDTADFFRSEHSIGAIVPFVKYYFSQAEILPIILSAGADHKQVDKLATWLKKNLPAESLVVFSMDFSHYLTKEEADLKDDLTRQLINNRDIEKILRLNNDCVDSPASLAVSILLADLNNLQINFLNHDNSFNLLSKKPQYTTSYFLLSLTN